MSAIDDFPRTREDRLLQRYWEERGSRGLLWLEVKLGLRGPGGWPNPRSHRRLDGLYIPEHPANEIRHWDDGGDLEVDLRAREVEVIEAKVAMNYDVIGQAIAGVDMFTRAYPSHGVVRQTVVVGGDPDDALDWVCRKLGIAVYRYRF